MTTASVAALRSALRQTEQESAATSRSRRSSSRVLTWDRDQVEAASSGGEDAVSAGEVELVTDRVRSTPAHRLRDAVDTELQQLRHADSETYHDPDADSTHRDVDSN